MSFLRFKCFYDFAFVIFTADSLPTSPEEKDIETLQTSFGKDLPQEDYRLLYYLLKEKALYYNGLNLISAGGPIFQTHSLNNTTLNIPRNRTRRIRRATRGGVISECCLNRCTYEELKGYCGDQRSTRAV